MTEISAGLLDRSIRDEVNTFGSIISHAVSRSNLLQDGYETPIASPEGRHASCRYIELSHGSLAPPGESDLYAPHPVWMGELVMRMHVARPLCSERTSELLYMRLLTRTFEGSVLGDEGHSEMRIARTFTVVDGRPGYFRRTYTAAKTIRRMAHNSSTITTDSQPTDGRNTVKINPPTACLRRAMEDSFNDIFIRYVTLTTTTGLQAADTPYKPDETEVM